MQQKLCQNRAKFVHVLYDVSARAARGRSEPTLYIPTCVQDVDDGVCTYALPPTAPTSTPVMSRRHRGRGRRNGYRRALPTVCHTAPSMDMEAFTPQSCICMNTGVLEGGKQAKTKGEESEEVHGGTIMLMIIHITGGSKPIAKRNLKTIMQ